MSQNPSVEYDPSPWQEIIDKFVRARNEQLPSAGLPYLREIAAAVYEMRQAKIPRPTILKWLGYTSTCRPGNLLAELIKIHTMFTTEIWDTVLNALHNVPLNFAHSLACGLAREAVVNHLPFVHARIADQLFQLPRPR